MQKIWEHRKLLQVYKRRNQQLTGSEITKPLHGEHSMQRFNLKGVTMIYHLSEVYTFGRTSGRVIHSVTSLHNGAELVPCILFCTVHVYRSFPLVWSYYTTAFRICPILKTENRLSVFWITVRLAFSVFLCYTETRD